MSDAVREKSWFTRAVLGIVVATFFSDVGHEMVTAVLPLYLTSVGLGAAALGVMEGIADFLFSLSKLAGGAVGHRVERKKPWAALGYTLTTAGSAAMALVQGSLALAVFRGVAWFGRGFRSPLRDFLLADEVGPKQFGRAYGIERTADMLGAVAGPLVAVALLALGASFRTILLVSIVPALVSVLAIVSMTRDRPAPSGDAAASPRVERQPLPKAFWFVLVGVLLFGLGDFSRTFLIFLAAGHEGLDGGRGISTAVLLYTLHNAVSAVVAYPVGHLGDRTSKSGVLVGGYALGVVTNGMLAVGGTRFGWLVVAIVLSGVYIAIEETLEKAVAAEILPREQRSLGLGILACANALGDMASSIIVGVLLARGHTTLAFALPASVGALGTLWLAAFVLRGRSRATG